MQVEGQAPVSQNEGQVNPAGGNSGSPAEDIANSYYDGPESGQEESQAAPEGEVGIDAEQKRQKTNPRWEKLLNDRKKDKEMIRALQEKTQQFEGDDFKKLASLRDLLRARPVYGDLLYHLLQGRDPQETVAELFKQEQRSASAPNNRPVEEEYDERTASYFKKIDEMERWKQERESEQQTFMQKQVEKYQGDINHHYKQRLTEDGFFDAKGKPVDGMYVTMVDNVMKALLTNSAQNPDIPTGEEFDHAYSTMKQCIKYMEDKIRRDMSKRSVSDVPPLSGTTSGQMPIGKSKPSDHDRVMDIANSFFG